MNWSTCAACLTPRSAVPVTVLGKGNQMRRRLLSRVLNVVLAVLLAGLQLQVPVAAHAAAPPVAFDDPTAALQKVAAADGAEADQHGSAVAISGDTAVVGAPESDDAGESSGSAYVYVRSGANWTQQAKLTAADAASGEDFGYSVAISGDTVVIGAHLDDDRGMGSGSAYVFVRSGDTWTRQAKLTAVDGAGADYFGDAVALSGDTAVIGAYGDDDAGQNSGSVYIFTRTGTDWAQQAKLRAADAAAFDYFGAAVAISSDTAVIGAHGDDSSSGSVYVFTRSGTDWEQQAKLRAADAAGWDYFGYSVAISGDTLVAGAYWDDDQGAESGSAYVFTGSGSSWAQQAKLTAADGAVEDYFGSSVAVSGDIAVIGAFQDDDDGARSGSAYRFVRSGSAWSQQAKLTAEDATEDGRFGYAVAISGDNVVIGAVFAHGVSEYSGAAYMLGVAAYPTDEDTPLSVDAPGVLGNDTDPDGDTLSAILVTDAAHGTLALAADGSFTYTPDADFNGTDSFTYTASDGDLTSGPATVTITVGAVNDAPAAADDSAETDEDTPLSVDAPGVLGNDTDPDGDTLSATLVTDAAHGTLALAADGSFTYTPDADFNGTDSFTYTASDGELTSGPATVTITVVPVDDPPAADTVRVAGPNRYDTAVEASKEGFPEGADTVVLATGADWPDALGGSALAGAVRGPLLLTTPGALRPEVAEEIARLGATKIYILGGAGAISAEVESALNRIPGMTVVRLGGVDRYVTGLIVANEVIRIAGTDFGGTAYVATGADFPDALAVSPLASARVCPVLLADARTNAVSLPSAVASAVIVGGVGVVSPEVEHALAGSLGEGNVERIFGADRYATAAAVAVHGVESGLSWSNVGIATGEDFPDSLCGGAMLGAMGSVMVLTPSDTLAPETEGVLTDNASEIGTVRIMGGTGALSDAVVTAIRAALGL